MTQADNSSSSGSSSGSSSTGSAARKEGIPEGLWMRCPECGDMLFRKVVAEALHVCPQCNYHFRIAARKPAKFGLNEVPIGIPMPAAYVEIIKYALGTQVAALTTLRVQIYSLEEAEKLGIPFLGGVPLHMEIRAKSDEGKPVVVSMPEGPHAQIYRELAQKAWGELQGTGAKLEPPQLQLGAGGRELVVTFPGAGPFTLSAEVLRVMSPSAEVQGHHPSERQYVPGCRDVAVTAIDPVGNYAVKLTFDDGHDTGIYSWALLHELGREQDARWARYLAGLAERGLSREP